jgi:hypothetical protein
MPLKGVPFSLEYRPGNEENADLVSTKSKAKRGGKARVDAGTLLPLPDFVPYHSEFP